MKIYILKEDLKKILSSPLKSFIRSTTEKTFVNAVEIILKSDYKNDKFDMKDVKQIMYNVFTYKGIDIINSFQLLRLILEQVNPDKPSIGVVYIDLSFQNKYIPIPPMPLSGDDINHVYVHNRTEGLIAYGFNEQTNKYFSYFYQNIKYEDTLLKLVEGYGLRKFYNSVAISFMKTKDTLNYFHTRAKTYRRDLKLKTSNLLIYDETFSNRTRDRMYSPSEGYIMLINQLTRDEIIFHVGKISHRGGVDLKLVTDKRGLSKFSAYSVDEFFIKSYFGVDLGKSIFISLPNTNSSFGRILTRMERNVLNPISRIKKFDFVRMESQYTSIVKIDFKNINDYNRIKQEYRNATNTNFNFFKIGYDVNYKYLFSPFRYEVNSPHYFNLENDRIDNMQTYKIIFDKILKLNLQRSFSIFTRISKNENTSLNLFVNILNVIIKEHDRVHSPNSDSFVNDEELFNGKGYVELFTDNQKLREVINKCFDIYGVSYDLNNNQLFRELLKSIKGKDVFSSTMLMVFDGSSSAEELPELLNNNLIENYNFIDVGKKIALVFMKKNMEYSLEDNFIIYSIGTSYRTGGYRLRIVNLNNKIAPEYPYKEFENVDKKILINNLYESKYPETFKVNLQKIFPSKGDKQNNIVFYNKLLNVLKKSKLVSEVNKSSFTFKLSVTIKDVAQDIKMKDIKNLFKSSSLVNTSLFDNSIHVSLPQTKYKNFIDTFHDVKKELIDLLKTYIMLLEDNSFKFINKKYIIDTNKYPDFKYKYVIDNTFLMIIGDNDDLVTFSFVGEDNKIVPYISNNYTVDKSILKNKFAVLPLNVEGLIDFVNKTHVVSQYDNSILYVIYLTMYGIISNESKIGRTLFDFGNDKETLLFVNPDIATDNSNLMLQMILSKNGSEVKKISNPFLLVNIDRNAISNLQNIVEDPTSYVKREFKYNKTGNNFYLFDNSVYSVFKNFIKSQYVYKSDNNIFNNTYLIDIDNNNKSYNSIYLFSDKKTGDVYSYLALKGKKVEIDISSILNDVSSIYRDLPENIKKQRISDIINANYIIVSEDLYNKLLFVKTQLGLSVNDNVDFNNSMEYINGYMKVFIEKPILKTKIIDKGKFERFEVGTIDDISVIYKKDLNFVQEDVSQGKFLKMFFKISDDKQMNDAILTLSKSANEFIYHVPNVYVYEYYSKKCNFVSCMRGSKFWKILENEKRMSMVVYNDAPILDLSSPPDTYQGRALMWEEDEWVLIDTVYGVSQLQTAIANKIRSFAWEYAISRNKRLYIRLGGGVEEHTISWKDMSIKPVNISQQKYPNENIKLVLENVKFNQEMKNKFDEVLKMYSGDKGRIRSNLGDAFWIDTFRYYNMTKNTLATYKTSPEDRKIIFN